jgi:hypothetical protein
MDEKVTNQSLLTNLFSQPQTGVFTVLDGASVEQLPQLLWKHKPQNVCLYRGELEPDMAAVAPYLVKLEFDHRFTKLVCEKGWGKHWGIFVITPAEVDMRTLRQHFRRFLMVLSPEGKSIYFRYYDPRVLRVYLPTCNAEEMKTVFGPVSSYIVEDEDSSVMLRLSSDSEKVRTEKISLAQSR